eukprot:4176948-Amphidinium_carterae.1
MAADADDHESSWDWWPRVSPGVSVTILQARAAGLRLVQRSKQWREAGEPLLAKRDYASVQDNRTLRELCQPGRMWLGHDVLLALLEPFTAPEDAGAKYWRQGSPVAKYLDWRGIALGCWGDRRCRRTALPHGIQICEDLALVGLALKPVMDGDYQEPSNWILDNVFRVGQAQAGKISQDAAGGWVPGDLLGLLQWPNLRTGSGHRPQTKGYNATRLFNVLETWYLAAIILQRWDDLGSVSHALGNVIMPGDPAYGQVEPEKPLPLESICGPRKPGPQPRPSSSSAAAPMEQPSQAKVQRYKAPPPTSSRDAHGTASSSGSTS